MYGVIQWRGIYGKVLRKPTEGQCCLPIVCATRQLVFGIYYWLVKKIKKEGVVLYGRHNSSA